MVGGSIAPPVAVFLSCWRVVLRALLAAANHADVECNQFSWCVSHSMSGLDAFFPMHVAIVLRHARTMCKTRRVCLLCPMIASRSGCKVMMSPSFMAVLKERGWDESCCWWERCFENLCEG